MQCEFPAKPRLVASDVDGTLLDPYEQVTPRTKAAVAAVVADRVPFVLATGRPPRWVAPVVDALGFAPLCVCGNGSVVYDSATDRVLASATLSVQDMAWLTSLAEHLWPGCGLAAERVGEHARDAVTPQFVSSPEYVHAWLNPDDTAVARAEVIADPAIKVLIRLAGARSSDMVRELAPHLQGRADVTYSTEDGLIELSAPGVTKASGLAGILERMVLPASSVVAFGDMPNDISLLQMAGHGVAMANAHPDLTAVADETTLSNAEDGVAEVLRRWWQ